jgi:hypothetical protein
VHAPVCGGLRKTGESWLRPLKQKAKAA